jgi:hypothetical protein
MIRSLLPSDFDAILKAINDAAQAYKDVIPNDRWKEPYMSAEKLKEEIEAGVRFSGWVEDKHLLRAAGIQPIEDTTLIRHACVLTKYQEESNNSNPSRLPTFSGKLDTFSRNQGTTSSLLYKGCSAS